MMFYETINNGDKKMNEQLEIDFLMKKLENIKSYDNYGIVI